MAKDEHKPLRVDIENRGEISQEEFNAISRQAVPLLTMQMVGTEWTIVIDDEFALALQRFEPLQRMRIATTMIEGLRKALQTITDK